MSQKFCNILIRSSLRDVNMSEVIQTVEGTCCGW